MNKRKQTFEEHFYQEIQKWLHKNIILNKDIPIIQKEFKKFISTKLRPVDRKILFDELFITTGLDLTDEGFKMLVRLETWAFNEPKKK